MAIGKENINLDYEKQLSLKDGALNIAGYELTDNIATPKGAATLEGKLKKGQITTSVVNRLHLIKLANDFPYQDKDYHKLKSAFEIKSFIDLCNMDAQALAYDPDDFLYCKNVHFPINRMITLRRFPYPCTDNIWDKETQGEPDIARMIGYWDQETNKLEELLGFSYKMKWKELTAEYEQAGMQGEQSGLSGYMKKAMKVFDPELWKNDLRGDNANNYDPKHDQNKVYGPVDSITNTHIRDIGLEFTKDFEITFEYELRSINGRTPEYAMKDIIGNILACTYQNAKFWPGARYWVGERPSKFTQHFQYMNSDDIDKVLTSTANDLKSLFATFSSKGSAIQQLKAAMTGGIGVALGKILDKVGRPGILVMNSLLSGEPTGFWHLTVGNPMNPVLSMGNLICEDVEFSFPTDSLSYGEFPTKLQVKVKLKPGQAKDRAGIETMFNMGKHRMYFAPKTVTVNHAKHIGRQTRGFFGFDSKSIDRALEHTFDFIADGVKTVTTTVKTEYDDIKSSSKPTTVSSSNANKLQQNANNNP